MIAGAEGHLRRWRQGKEAPPVAGEVRAQQQVAPIKLRALQFQDRCQGEITLHTKGASLNVCPFEDCICPI